jgi:hypothetical protein
MAGGTMSCCGRIPAADIRKAIRRRRASRWACSILTPAASQDERAGGDTYRAWLRIVLSLGGGISGRHPPCTGRWSDKRRILTH